MIKGHLRRRVNGSSSWDGALKSQNFQTENVKTINVFFSFFFILLINYKLKPLTYWCLIGKMMTFSPREYVNGQFPDWLFLFVLKYSAIDLFLFRQKFWQWRGDVFVDIGGVVFWRDVWRPVMILSRAHFYAKKLL